MALLSTRVPRRQRPRRARSSSPARCRSARSARTGWCARSPDRRRARGRGGGRVRDQPDRAQRDRGGAARSARLLRARAVRAAARSCAPAGATPIGATRVHATADRRRCSLLVAAAVWPPALLLASVHRRRVRARRCRSSVVARTVGAHRRSSAARQRSAPRSLLVPVVGRRSSAPTRRRSALLPRAAARPRRRRSRSTPARPAPGSAPSGCSSRRCCRSSVATGERLAWAGRAWMLAAAVVRVRVAAEPPRPCARRCPRPKGVLVPAALGLALAVGLGVAAFLDDLRTFHFGWRQFAAVAAAVGIALPVLGLRGRHASRPLGPVRATTGRRSSRGWTTSAPTATSGAVGRRPDDPAGRRQGRRRRRLRADARRRRATRVRSWAAPEERRRPRCSRDAIARGARDTTRSGSATCSRPTGVRYVAFVEPRRARRRRTRSAAIPRSTDALAAQLDLAVSRVERRRDRLRERRVDPAARGRPPDTRAWPGRQRAIRSAAALRPSPLARCRRRAAVRTRTRPGRARCCGPSRPNSGWRATVDGDTRAAERRVRLDQRVRARRARRRSTCRSRAVARTGCSSCVELLLWIGRGRRSWWRDPARAAPERRSRR